TLLGRSEARSEAARRWQGHANGRPAVHPSSGKPKESSRRRGAPQSSTLRGPRRPGPMNTLGAGEAQTYVFPPNTEFMGPGLRRDDSEIARQLGEPIEYGF